VVSVVQPSVYSYEQIIAAALEIVREHGWSAVTARAIAKQLGSSTMPIYSRVTSVDDLEQDVRRQACAVLKDYQRCPFTSDTLLNAAFGYVRFARDEKNLFRYLYLERPEALNAENASGMSQSFVLDFGEGSEQQKALEEVQRKGQDDLVQYTWIFVHGLATLVSSGTYASVSDKAILRFLTDAGQAFHMWSSSDNPAKGR